MFASREMFMPEHEVHEQKDEEGRVVSMVIRSEKIINIMRILSQVPMENRKSCQEILGNFALFIARECDMEIAKDIMDTYPTTIHWNIIVYPRGSELRDWKDLEPLRPCHQDHINSIGDNVMQSLLEFSRRPIRNFTLHWNPM